ncbi:DNA-3-methyladenine glycosylase family protein [Paucisalibacillus globulus]|uniref:DNA-3-methyladenine glycosylase family protein n=1 Tax=Paucisalibacillus globulus TaxID=351095 RepID=UPI000BB6BFA3|nr:DNA-3-methyladenine glycosylase [Paucisalibacillus globulus]
MRWLDDGSTLEIFPPKEFDFGECLVFLGKSEGEVLHSIKDGYLYKLIKIDDELILLKIGSNNYSIQVEFPIGTPSETAREEVADYIWEWFDLGQNLEEFYEVARNDAILAPIANTYYGLRIICIPDLFEALTWAILGQQINLTFAYKLKKRFVEQYGESITYDGQIFWLFPTHEKIAELDIEDLKKLQFSTRKAEYIIGVAGAISDGRLSKEKLLQLKDYRQVHQSLVSIRGVGAWTADYVMMKCLHYPSAFPIADVGLHNAIKQQLGLESKPTIDEIETMAINWKGWEAYATFYLWRSLDE